MIVVVEEESESDSMHLVRFGKGESFSHESSQTLAQGAVETFHMIGARFGVALRELVGGNDIRIRLPDVSKTMRLFVGVGNGFPHEKTGLLAPIANGKRHHLPGAPTQGQPNPAFVLASFHEAPNLVQLQFITLLKLFQSRL